MKRNGENVTRFHTWVASGTAAATHTHTHTYIRTRPHTNTEAGWDEPEMRAIVNINTGPHIYARQELFEINILQTKPVSHSVCCKPDSIRAGPPSINQLRAQPRPTTYVAHNMLHRGCNHDDTHTTLTFRSDIVVNTAVMRFILSHYCNRYKQMPLMLLLTLATLPQRCC